MNQWYYIHDGEQKGPITSEALLLLVNNGTIDWKTPVWKQNLKEWVTLDTQRSALMPPPSQPQNSSHTQEDASLFMELGQERVEDSTQMISSTILKEAKISAKDVSQKEEKIQQKSGLSVKKTSLIKILLIIIILVGAGGGYYYIRYYPRIPASVQCNDATKARVLDFLKESIGNDTAFNLSVADDKNLIFATPNKDLIQGTILLQPKLKTLAGENNAKKEPQSFQITDSVGLIPFSIFSDKELTPGFYEALIEVLNKKETVLIEIGTKPASYKADLNAYHDKLREEVKAAWSAEKAFLAQFTVAARNTIQTIQTKKPQNILIDNIKALYTLIREYEAAAPQWAKVTPNSEAEIKTAVLKAKELFTPGKVINIDDLKKWEIELSELSLKQTERDSKLNDIVVGYPLGIF